MSSDRPTARRASPRSCATTIVTTTTWCIRPNATPGKGQSGSTSASHRQQVSGSFPFLFFYFVLSPGGALSVRNILDPWVFDCAIERSLDVREHHNCEWARAKERDRTWTLYPYLSSLKSGRHAIQHSLSYHMVLCSLHPSSAHLLSTLSASIFFGVSTIITTTGIIQPLAGGRFPASRREEVRCLLFPWCRGWMTAALNQRGRTRPRPARMQESN